jgi:hypothetical protein
MPDGLNRNELIPGLNPPPRGSWTGLETVAAAASVLWVLIVILFWMLLPSGGGFPVWAVILVVLLLPVAMIWVAALAFRAITLAESESRRLQYALDALRQSILADRQARTMGTAPPVVSDTTRSPSPRDTAPPPRAQPEEQPRLALIGETEDDATQLSNTDLILALHFPDNDRDETGFAALRLALRDRQTRQLVQASQDVLTLMSQDGIYMDDLVADRARPDVWRRFAHGERGRAVADLGGIHDRECLAITIARLREDAIFRDAAHHFLRLFDRRLAAFEPNATDEDLVMLAETRTARAFMLLGRVTGIFD